MTSTLITIDIGNLVSPDQVELFSKSITYINGKMGELRELMEEIRPGNGRLMLTPENVTRLRQLLDEISVPYQMVRQIMATPPIIYTRALDTLEIAEAR